MATYDYPSVIAQAKAAAVRCETVEQLAETLSMPESSLRRILKKEGYSFARLIAEAAYDAELGVGQLHQQIKYWKRQATRAEKALGERAWLRDEVASLMSVLEPVPVPAIKDDGKYQEQVGVLEFSDLHMGAFVPPGQLGMFGEYNSDLAEQRAIYTFQKFAHITKMQPFPVNTVKVYLLGDEVEHNNLRPGHAKQTDAHVIQQTVRASNVLSHALRFLCGEFGQVEVHAVPGNHGRATRKSGEQLPDESYDHLVYHIIEQALASQPNFTMHNYQTWYFVDEIFGFKFLGLHGEDILSWAGIPFYGIERAVKDYYMMFGQVTKETLRSMDPTTSLAIDQILSLLMMPDYVCIGHFHNKMAWDIMGVEALANGALSGISLYSTKRLRRLSRPKQMMFFVHPEQGVGVRCPINLSHLK